MKTPRSCALALATILLTSAAIGQDPPNVIGHVVSPAGVPLADVEVRVEGGTLAARTDGTGAFALVNAPTGYQNLGFRRIGYLPATISLKVPDISGTVKVMMVPIPPTLDPVQVTARMNVIAGIVLDPHNRPVPGALVDIIGVKNAQAISDEGGGFTFASVQSGVVVVRARKEGYAMATYSLPLEDWRGLVLHLDSIDAKPHSGRRAELSGIGNAVEATWTQTRLRLSRRAVNSVVVTREDLAPLADMHLGEAIRHAGAAASLAVDLRPGARNICVIEDGRRVIGLTSLDTYNTDDVDWVELYPPGTEGSLGRLGQGGGCNRLSSFFAVVWFR
jgi:hypothetical protein